MTKKATQLVHVRMPKELHRKIQREAERKGQTINAEILMRLAQAFDAAKALDAAENALTEVGRSVAGFKTELENRQKALNVTHTLNEKLIDEMASRLAKRLENSFPASERKELVSEVLRDHRLLDGISAYIIEAYVRGDYANHARVVRESIERQRAWEQRLTPEERRAIEQDIKQQIEQQQAQGQKQVSGQLVDALTPPTINPVAKTDTAAKSDTGAKSDHDRKTHIR